MPELPDVETHRRYVDATSLHRSIADVMLREQLVEDTSPQRIREVLSGSELASTRRHGKHLFIEVGDHWLRLHFGMTGYLDAESIGSPPEHTELLIEFEDESRLAYVNQRKFGAISLVDDVDEFIAANGLGPDPLEDGLGKSVFEQRLGARSGTIKGTLMNQSFVAGLGNVYTDEILFQASVHPESEAAVLSDHDRAHLYDVMIRVMELAIERGAEVDDLPRRWLLPHRVPGSPCPRDNGTIEKSEVSGRATYICAAHQALIR